MINKMTRTGFVALLIVCAARSNRYTPDEQMTTHLSRRTEATACAMMVGKRCIDDKQREGASVDLHQHRAACV